MKFYKTLILILLILSTSIFPQELLPEKVDSLPENITKAKAIFLGKPKYPSEALVKKLSGSVQVKITINEEGIVISAKAETGDPIFWKVAEDAAFQSKFIPAKRGDKPIRFTGNIVFNFKRQTDWENVGMSLLTLLNEYSTIEAGSTKLDALWDGFEEESKEFLALQADESINGKRRRAANLINIIRYKLKSKDQVGLWQFNLGIAFAGMARSATQTNGEKNFYSYLDDLADLVKIAPEDFSPKRLATLVEVASYSKKHNLTKDKRQELVITLTESRNKYLNGIF